MDQHRQAQRLGLAPERIERQFADVRAFDVGRDNDAAGAESEAALKLRRRRSASVRGTDEIQSKRSWCRRTIRPAYR
jgi:hypothetical protein